MSPVHILLTLMHSHYRIKLAAAATGVLGCGQENDLGNHYRAHKKAVKKYEKMYHLIATKFASLDSNVEGEHAVRTYMVCACMHTITVIFPCALICIVRRKATNFWSDWDNSDVVRWVRRLITGKGGRPKLGFTMSKAVMVERVNT